MLQDKEQNEYKDLMNKIQLSDDFKAKTALKMKEANTQKSFWKNIRYQKILTVAASAVLIVGIGAAGYFHLSDMNYDIIDGMTTFSGYQNPKKPFIHHAIKESQPAAETPSLPTVNPPVAEQPATSSQVPAVTAPSEPTASDSSVCSESSSTSASSSSSSQSSTQSESGQSSAVTATPPAMPREIEQPQVQEPQTPTDMINNPPGVNKANADLAWNEICTVESETISKQKSAIQKNSYYQESLNQIDESLIAYVGEEAYQQWYQQFQKEVNGQMQDKYRYSQPYMSDGTANYAALENSLWGFIQHFQIPKEEFIKLYQPTKEKTRESLNILHYPKEAYQKYNCRITDKQVDALYSEDPNQVMAAFAGYDAAYVNGELYSYTWFDKHIAEDYIAVGFTSAQLEEIVAAMSNQQVSYINEQGETVVIYDLEIIKNEITRMKELEVAAKDKTSSSEKNKTKTK